ncbi:uncharacterized protein [Aegilops tauschii subsp. strangulata]|uniref:uncharacterized protein n=1 Tax=Aegilops tauschii subsp. strangulata TaxID=200361 RepID=UPI003CC87EA3
MSSSEKQSPDSLPSFARRRPSSLRRRPPDPFAAARRCQPPTSSPAPGAARPPTSLDPGRPAPTSSLAPVRPCRLSAPLPHTPDLLPACHRPCSSLLQEDAPPPLFFLPPVGMRAAAPLAVAGIPFKPVDPRKMETMDDGKEQRLPRGDLVEADGRQRPSSRLLLEFSRRIHISANLRWE